MLDALSQVRIPGSRVTVSEALMRANEGDLSAAALLSGVGISHRGERLFFNTHHPGLLDLLLAPLKHEPGYRANRSRRVVSIRLLVNSYV